MSLTNPNSVVTEQRLHDFYGQISPYLGGMPEVLANKFSKGDIYSTEERLIGQWQDGKPLYQRVITGTTGATAGSSATIASIPNISDIDSIVKVKYMLLYNGAENPSYVIEGNYYESNTYNICYWISDGVIKGTASSAYTNKPVIAILDYTKITDSAISIGDETDYSTTEKIVGTWIDGSPIWQKTVNIGALPNNVEKSVSWNDAGILNIKQVISLIGIAVQGTQNSFPLNCPNHTSNGTYECKMETDSRGINIQTWCDRTSWNGYVTIQYTKTS